MKTTKSDAKVKENFPRRVYPRVYVRTLIDRILGVGDSEVAIHVGAALDAAMVQLDPVPLLAAVAQPFLKRFDFDVRVERSADRIEIEIANANAKSKRGEDGYLGNPLVAVSVDLKGLRAAKWQVEQVKAHAAEIAESFARAARSFAVTIASSASVDAP